MLDDYRAGEPDRVYLAALKLAEGSVETLAQILSDPEERNLLAAAEYPHYTRTFAVPPEQRQQIIDEDWADHVEWLYRE